MSWRPLTTFEDLLEARQNFDKIPIVHVSYASSYLALLQCNLVEHPIVDIWEDLDTLKFLQHGEYFPEVTFPKLHPVIEIAYNNSPNATHGRIITSSDAYHKVTRWFLHHINGLVLFRRYIRSLDTLQLNILIPFSPVITIENVCMFKSETSLLGVNNVIKWELPFPLNSSRFLHSLFRACSIASHVI
jgi:hypothetical protein